MRWQRIQTAFEVAFLSGAGFVLAAPGTPQSSASPAAKPTAFTLSAPLAPEAAAKVDPHILLALALPERSASALVPVGRRIVLAGKSVEELRFPVLIQTTLSDGELAALGAPPDTRAGDIVTSEVLAADLNRLASDPGVQVIEASHWLEPSLDVSIPEIRADLVHQGQPPAGYTGRGVLFGLLDDGLDLTHQDFQDAGGHTRVLYAWDQLRNGSAPAPFAYGYEYTKAMIDAGQAGPFRDEGGHGSHVAGIAVGDGSSLPANKYRGVAWEADILVVRNGYCDLFCYGAGNPNPIYQADSKGSVDGLNYMLQKRTQLGRPLVVNQSQGVTMGPHDGTTLFEKAYDRLVGQGLILCVAAGNEEEAGGHGRITVARGGTGTLKFTKSNDGQNAVTVQFECWTRAGDQFSWELTPPGDLPIDIPPAVSPGNEYQARTTAHADSVFFWSTTAYPGNNEGNVSVYIQNRAAGVQTGEWRLRALAENTIPAGGQIDLYLERNQPGVRVTLGVNADALIDMPGTASGVITVASYNTKNSWLSQSGPAAVSGYPLGEISRFSSWGPRRDGVQKPDLAAPGAFILSALAAGHDPEDPRAIDAQGKHLALAGTSMASPHVAGTVALMLQKKPDLSAADVKTILRQTARLDNFTGAVPNFKFGYGKLDAKAAVDAAGSGRCATQPGDATGEGAVNVRDVVAVVNDILQIHPLGSGGRACADLDSSGTLNAQDLAALVSAILHAATPERASARASESAGPTALPEPVVWSRQWVGSAFRITLDGTRVGAFQACVSLPRGFEPAGSPTLRGAVPGAQTAGNQRFGLHLLVAYNPLGDALADGPVTLEVPVVQTWDGGQGPEAFAIHNLILSDPEGRALHPVERPTAEPVPTAAAGRLLGPSEPNPTRGPTRIQYDLPKSGKVALTLFDAAGRRIRDLSDGWQMEGPHRLTWDGRDDSGLEAPAGVYFLRLRSAEVGDSRKILVVR